MYRTAKPIFLHVLTPLHAGSGQELGIVDLPIQREKHTGFPKIESSSLKGAIREVMEEKLGRDNNSLLVAFGPEDGDEHAGAISFTEARILLFPVKSARGVFAYITCPQVLKRFKDDLEIVDKISDTNTVNNLFPNDEIPDEGTVSDSNLLVNSNVVVLEEFTFDAKEKEVTKQFAEKLSKKLCISDVEKRLVVLSDDDFADFVKLSTEVITRTKINPATGTVERGALFTEEYLPAETLLYTLVLASPPFTDNSDLKDANEVLNFVLEGLPEIIQIGGNATIGKGLTRVIKID